MGHRGLRGDWPSNESNRARGVRPSIRLAIRSGLADFSLTTSIRPVSNARSGESGEVPEDVVDAHLGNLPGRREHASRGGRTWSRDNSVSRV